ncbi:MMPL family transporter [Streptacidiphilus sp. N1-10]|uniref:MMPL family transporter n=1 Tax=Streptacidiphilus jeojiensis TaxID=3229225 RepID=A0ABV6XVZ8_9ACTN
MHSVFRAIGRFSVRFRWPLVALWVGAAIAVVHLLPSLSSVTQNDNTSFLPANAPSQHAATLASNLQPSNLTSITVIVARDGQLTAADESAIAGLQQKLGKEPSVHQVKDTGRSADGKAEQLQVLANLSATGGQKQQEETTIVADLRSAVSATSLPSGLQAHLAGPVATDVDNSKQSGNSSSQTQGLSLLLIIVVLAFVFRAVLAPLVTLLPALLVVLMSGPLIAEAAVHGLSISSLASVLLVVLVLGAGTDYGLFLVFRVREELRAGTAPKEAVVSAVEKVGESITFSAGTVIAALLSLLAASFGVYSNLGIPLAIGIGLMLLAGLTLLPALLAILGRAVFWPSRIRPGIPKTGLWGRISGSIVQRPVATLCIGLAFFGALAAASTGYTPAGFSGGTSAPAGTDSAQGQALLTEHFPRTTANPTMLVFQLPQSAWADTTALADAQQQLQSASQFKNVTGPLSPNGVNLTAADYTDMHTALGPADKLSPTPPLPTRSAAANPAGGNSSPAHTKAGAGTKAAGGTGTGAALIDGKFTVAQYQAYRSTAQYVSPDGTTVQFRVELTAGSPDTSAAMNAVPDLRAKTTAVAQKIGATDSGVLGQAAGLYDVSDTSSNDLGSVIPIAIAVIGLLLILVMRSLVAPLYLIASVALSYFSSLGLAVLLFIKLDHSGGLVFILPFLMFVFLLALGEDYNILVMTRIREEAHHLPLREAVRKALNATGTTVTSAGLVLAGTFAVLAINGANNGNNQLRDVGTGLALGILMDTFLVRTLLVPSAVLLLGRWNWWPSKLVHRQATPAPEAEPAHS